MGQFEPVPGTRCPDRTGIASLTIPERGERAARSGTRSDIGQVAAGESAAVLTVNAGSSSLRLDLVDGGSVVDSAHAERAMDPDAARAELSEFLGRHLNRDVAPVIGHRLVHGGDLVRAADGRRRRGAAAVRESPISPRCTCRPRSPARRGAARRLPESRTCSARTPPSTPACRRAPRPTRCPPSGGAGRACAATASTDCPTPGRWGGRRSCSDGPPRSCTWCSPISAEAPRCARSGRAAAWTPRWGSPRWTGSR